MLVRKEWAIHGARLTLDNAALEELNSVPANISSSTFSISQVTSWRANSRGQSIANGGRGTADDVQFARAKSNDWPCIVVGRVSTSESRLIRTVARVTHRIIIPTNENYRSDTVEQNAIESLTTVCFLTSNQLQQFRDDSARRRRRHATPCSDSIFHSANLLSRATDNNRRIITFARGAHR